MLKFEKLTKTTCDVKGVSAAPNLMDKSLRHGEVEIQLTDSVKAGGTYRLAQNRSGIQACIAAAAAKLEDDADITVSEVKCSLIAHDVVLDLTVADGDTELQSPINIPADADITVVNAFMTGVTSVTAAVDATAASGTKLTLEGDEVKAGVVRVSVSKCVVATGVAEDKTAMHDLTAAKGSILKLNAIARVCDAPCNKPATTYLQPNACLQFADGE